MNIEALISVFTIVDGEFKVLLNRKKSEPYKGYWIVPSAPLTKESIFEEAINECLSTKFDLQNVEYEQCYIFDGLGRIPSKRVLGASFLSILDSRIAETIETDECTDWFNIDKLPKLGYDHELILEKSIQMLKHKIIQSVTLKKIFPSDFTLPEIQRMYEQVLGIDLDRRNFRKRFVKAELVEETGDKSTTTNGRPAKLYRFKEEIENKLLF